jgi:hypothetical protein
MVTKKPKSRGPLPLVSLGGVTYEESLPLPWVKYPNHYGTFILFSETENGTYYFCKCNQALVTNLLELNRRHPPGQNIDPCRMAPLDSLHVPDEIAELTLKNQEDPLSALKFKEKLCHRCNLIHPSIRYCHEMYGGKFDQSFGWYVNQTYLRNGVDSWSKIDFLPEICPDKIKQVIEKYIRANHQMIEEYDKCSRSVDLETRKKLIKEIKKPFNKANRELKNTFINLTRKDFGFRKVGEGWLSETIVFKIIQEILPNQEIIMHHRPVWLENLELDIYVPNLHFGIEYQGQQHFKPIKIWGGEKALKEVQERDKRKADICRKIGITLVHINYTDPLTKSFISKILEINGIQVDQPN